MEAKRPAQAVQAVAPKSLRGKSSQRRSAAPELWPMVAKTAVGSAERWQLPPACPWAAAQEDRARSCLARRPMAIDRADRAGPISKTCARSEEHTSELPSLMRISNALFCLKNK